VIDFIWIAGVLHHLPNEVNTIISNISYIIKKDGFVLIDEPNKLNLFNYLNMRLSKADPTGRERPLSLNKIKRLLLANNFTILKSDTYEFISPIGLIFNKNIVINLCNTLDSYINKTFLKAFSLRWYIFAMSGKNKRMNK